MNINKWIRLCTLFLALAGQLVFGGVASAGSIAITSMGPNGSWGWPGATIGYSFSVSQSISVTDLGVWDENANGLAESHQVGIFTTGGALLVSTTVTSADTLLNSFRYHSIAPYALGPGTYVMGAYFAGWGDTGAAAATITTSPEITFIDNLYLYGSGFTLPTVHWSGFDAGNIGPNFIYQTSQVPEPVSLALLGLGLAGLGFRRRKNP